MWLKLDPVSDFTNPHHNSTKAIQINQLGSDSLDTLLWFIFTNAMRLNAVIRQDIKCLDFDSFEIYIRWMLAVLKILSKYLIIRIYMNFSSKNRSVSYRLKKCVIKRALSLKRQRTSSVWVSVFFLFIKPAQKWGSSI